MPNTIHLSLISFVLMFLDMLLIRLIGTEVRIFSYVPNLVLLTVFMGTGIGMYIKRITPLNITLFCITLLTGILLTGVFSGITQLLAPVSNSYIWSLGEPTAPIIQILWGFIQLSCLLLLITILFIPIGKYISILFGQGKQTIYAYGIHILFSIIGMWAFFGLSYAAISPYIGILISEILLLMLIPKKKLLVPTLLIVITFLLIILSSPKNNDIWSPYQKLSISPLINDNPLHKYIIRVNNVGFMVLSDLSEQSKSQLIKKSHKITPNLNFLDGYMLPYIMKPSSQDVLIIGAGGGNDASAAIRAGIPNIDAVEIDPKVIQLGALHHPEHPYFDNKINIINNDGRSYIKQTNKRYDIVVYGFADSHTTNSNITNIQLDNYLYTLESYQEVKNILKPDGIFFLSFSVPRPWIGGHIQQTLTEAFHQKPVVFTLENDADCLAGCDGTFFVTSTDRNKLDQQISHVAGYAQFINDRHLDFPVKTDILRDDWPYLYLQNKRIPRLHSITAFIMLIFFIFLGKKVSLFSNIKWKAFFLGAGFLLYEFQNIGKTSLIYGSTWTVNVYTITATLFMGLLAVFIYSKFNVPLFVSYFGLFLSLCLELLIPIQYFNGMSFGWRLGVTSVLLYIPVFFSGLVFVDMLKQTKEKQSFLGSNLIGSFIGGLLCLLSYIFGAHALLYAVMGLYILSLITHYNIFRK